MLRDTMTPEERLRTVIGLGVPDRVPVAPMIPSAAASRAPTRASLTRRPPLGTATRRAGSFCGISYSAAFLVVPWLIREADALDAALPDGRCALIGFKNDGANSYEASARYSAITLSRSSGLKPKGPIPGL